MLLAATGASGGGVNLSWNDCGLAGSMDQVFACNTNAGGLFVMYASFDPNNDLSQLVGGTAVFDFESAGAQLPFWWEFKNAGTCRENSMSVNTNFVSGPYSCADPWAGAATGSFSYTIAYSGPNTAQLVVSFGVPEPVAEPVLAGTEYYAFKVLIDRARTVGTGACANCAEPVCIVLDGIRLYQANGLADQCLPNPRDRHFITWQGGVIYTSCPSYGHTPPGDCPTPTLRNTWGQVKSLYR